MAYIDLVDADGNETTAADQADFDGVREVLTQGATGDPTAMTLTKLVRVLDVTGTHIIPDADANSAPLVHDSSIPRTWHKSRIPVAATPSTADGTDYTHADYLGAYASLPDPADHGETDRDGLIFYHTNLHNWYKRIAISGLTGFRWNRQGFDTLITTSSWLFDRVSANGASHHIGTYDSNQTYFFYNTTTGTVQTLSNYTAPVGQTHQWEYEAVSDDELTPTELHYISLIPGLEDKTQELVVENSYTWADSSDGDIALRNDFPPVAWLGTALWSDDITASALDEIDHYLVLRIGTTDNIEEWRVERTRGTAEHVYHGSSFRRIHRTQTAYKYYAYNNVQVRNNDVLQVQKGTFTGEVTEYHGAVAGTRITSEGVATGMVLSAGSGGKGVWVAAGGTPGRTPAVGSGTTFPTVPAPGSGDLFFFNADVASGLDWKDTDGTTDLTAATIGDLARYDGTDWIKVVNVIGGDIEIETLTVTETLPDAFNAPIDEQTSVALSNTTLQNFLALTEANVVTNRGGFVIETGANAKQRIKVAAAGRYQINASILVDVTSGGAQRDAVEGDIVILRAGVVVAGLDTRGTAYVRATAVSDLHITVSHAVDLLADDQIELRLKEVITTDAATYTIGGDKSNISITRIVGTPDIEGGGGAGYGPWTDIASVTGAISSVAVTVALDTDQDIDDYDEMFIHIEANDTNDQRSISPRFRVEDVPVTALAGGGLLVGFPGNNTDEGSILVRRNTDGDELVLDPHGSVISFPATAVTTIVARSFSASDETTAGQQSGSGVLTRVNIHEPPSDPFPMNVTPTGMALSEGSENQIFFTAVEKARVERVVLIYRIDDTFNIIADISKEEMDRIPANNDGRPDPIVGTDDAECHYLSGRTQISADSREPLISNPTWAYVDFRRLASRYGICIWFGEDSTTLRWRSVRTYCNSDADIDLVSGAVYHV